MVEIVIKDTGIRVTCKTYEEAFWIYHSFGHQFTVIIDDEELKKMGPIEGQPNSYCAGYTKQFFKKYFKEV